MNYNSLLNKPKTKNHKKTSLSVINKKIDTLDSDISRLYKKYALYKKERQNQEKDQKTIINRIKYLEDEEKKMRLKCEIQMQKINSLTKKINNSHKNKAKVRQKIKNNNQPFLKNTINNNNLKYNEEEYKATNNSFNYMQKINAKTAEKKKKDSIRLIDDKNGDFYEIFQNEKNDLENEHYGKKLGNDDLAKTDIFKDTKIIIENLKNKLKLNNSLILGKSKNIIKEEDNNIDSTDIPSLSKDYSNIIKNSKNKSISTYNPNHNHKIKYKSIKHFKTNINKGKKIKNSNSNLISENSKSFHKYKRNNSLMHNHKYLKNIYQLREIIQNSSNNNSYIISKTLTNHKMDNNEEKEPKINNLKLCKTIEVKRKKLGNIKDNNNSTDLIGKIKKIKIIKKNKVNQVNRKNILSHKGNKDIPISYDFIINDDKIYYNNNNKYIHKDLSSQYYDNLYQNYILIKNEEKIKNIIHRNKSVITKENIIY